LSSISIVFRSNFLAKRIKGVIDQLDSRQAGFRPGKRIRLADGREWTFPVPTDGGSALSAAALGEYQGLIQAVLESEEPAERTLSELALAIFLLGLNYRLSPEDYQHLFTFEHESSDLGESQTAFHDLTDVHLRYLVAAGVLAAAPPPARSCWYDRFSRLLARVRRLLRIRWWPLTSSNGEVVPLGEIGNPSPISGSPE
jgi:hypothetical protein